MKLHYLVFPLAIMMTGCSVTPATVSSNTNAQKSAIDICATTGAALQAMVVAGAQGALQKIKPEAEVLEPICKQTTPSNAVTAAQAQAYQKIISAAAPYMGD